MSRLPLMVGCCGKGLVFTHSFLLFPSVNLTCIHYVLTHICTILTFDLHLLSFLFIHSIFAHPCTYACPLALSMVQWSAHVKFHLSAPFVTVYKCEACVFCVAKSTTAALHLLVNFLLTLFFILKVDSSYYFQNFPVTQFSICSFLF